MAGSDLSGLFIGIGANTATLQSDFNAGAAMAQKFAADVSATISRIGSNANLSGVSNQVQGLTSDFDRLKGVVSTVFSVGLGVGSLREIEQLADSYQNVSNRIRTTVSDTDQYAAASQRVFEIAQQTSRSLDDTAKTYQRVEQAIAATGVSQTQAQQQALSITKTLNEEIVVSGASAGEASRAIMDLVHGLAGGEIQSRQFNQVMRQMPDLGKQLADGLGVSVQQLEKMVHAGLPAQTLLKGLSEQATDIDAKFNALPKTFSQTWSVLENAVEKYVGETAQASSVTSILKSGIIGLADNIKIVATGAEAVGAAMALWLGGKGLSSIGAMASSLKDAALAQGEYKTAAALSAEGDIAAAEASIKATAATVARLDAENDLRIAKLAELQTTQQALITEQAELEARQRTLAVGVDVIATEQRLIAVRTELSGTTAKIATLEDAMAASQARATLAEQAETAATAALAESKTALVVAQAEATSAMGLLTRAGSSLFTLMGGWTTVVLAAAAGIYYLATAQSEAQKEADKLAQVTRDVTAASADMTPALEKNAESAYTAAQSMLELAKARQASVEAEAKANANQPIEFFSSYAIAVDQARGDVARLSDEMNNLAGAILKAKLAAAGKSLWESMFPDLRAAMAQIDALSDGIDKQSDHFAKMAATYGKGNAAVVQYEKSQELAKLSIGQTDDAIVQIKAALDEKYAADLKNAAAADAAVASHKAYTKALTEQQRALKDYASDVQNLNNLDEQLAEGLGGPYLSALRTYQKGIDLTTKTWNDAWVAGKANADLAQRIGDEQDALDARRQRTNEQIKAQHDAMAQANIDLQLQLTLMTTLPQNQAAVIAGQKAYNDALKAGVDLFGDAIPEGERIKDVLDAQLPAYVAVKQKINDLTEAQKLNEEAAHQWQDIWKQAGDTISTDFAQDVVEGKSLMKSLTDVAKQTVEAIIAYFTRLMVINPILNSVFGGQSGFSMLSTGQNSSFGGMSSFGGGGGFNLNGISSWFGGSSAAAYGSAAQSVGVLSDLGAGGNAATATAFTTDWGAAASAATDTLEAGAPNIGSSIGTSAGSSFLSTAVPVISGIIAGLGEFKAAGGGVAGAAGAAAYGVGTASIAIGAGAALSGGLAAGLAAVPVVGWVAIGLMVLDKLTGGGVFGTAWKPTGNTTTTLSTSDGSGDINATAEESKKKALFGGRSWRRIDVDVDQSAIDQFNSDLSKISDGVNAFAKQFSLTGQVLNSAFSQDFDKNGKVTATRETINGVSYNDTTSQDYESRLQSESFVKVLDDMGLGASQFVAGVQDDVQALASAVQDLASVAQNANTNLANGFKFMALDSTQTLADVVKFTEGLEQSGESLTQTYARLVQAQQTYDQFVAQFAPAPTYVDSFEQSIGTLYKQMNDAMASANAYAKAAGAATASQDDLTNIMKYYTAQMAAATAQLAQSAQSAAFALGLTSQAGSLDQINQAISDLEGSTSTAADNVSNFGSAIQSASKQASDAINLLLGDLSPLNDQQKLQTALQGLRAGTVSAEDVLAIGRRLYASSEAYNQLFAQVQQYAGRGGGGSSGAPHGGGSSQTGSGFNISNLSAADQQKLKDLYAQRDTLQAAQTLSQFQAFAQQVAELATAKGEDFTQVLKDMGVNQADLEKGLGIKDDATLKAYIEGYQKQIDSAGNNASSIVAAIQQLPAQIAAAVAGNISYAGDVPTGGVVQQPPGKFGGPSTQTPPTPTPTQPPTPAPNPGNGGSNNGFGPTTNSRTLTPADVEAFGASVGAHVLRGNTPLFTQIASSQRRNRRWETA